MRTLRVTMMWVLPVMVALTCGCNAFQPKQREKELLDLYSQAESKAAAGDYGGAVPLLKQYVEVTPPPKNRTDALLLLGD
jgi:predicted component of type VI protein secretion system